MKKKLVTNISKVIEQNNANNNCDLKLNSDDFDSNGFPTKFDYSMNVADYILEFENILPSSICDAILKEYKNSDLWADTRVGEGGVNKEVRNVESIFISAPEIIQINFNNRKRLDDEVFKAVSKSMFNYMETFNLARITNDSGYDLLRYKKGSFYIQHTDSFTRNMRTISCSICLNDNYEGGEFAFFDRKIVKKPKKGSALLFPSNFLYPHEVMPVTKGTRYSIITWLM